MKGRLSRRLYLRISVGAVILTLAPRSANAFTLRVGGTLGEWGRKVSDNWKKSDPGKAGIRYQKWVNRTTDKAKRELKQLFNRTFRSGFIEPPTIIPCGSGSLAPAYFVNGVRNTRNDAVVAATALSIHLDRQILLIHNPTTGWVDDLIECFFDRIWVYPLPVSNKTTRQLASVFEGIKNEVSIITHSQGCIICQNALMIADEFGSGKGIRSKVRWVACAPPITSIVAKHDPKRLTEKFTHFTNRSDPVAQKLGQYPDGDAIAGTFAFSEHSFKDRYLDYVDGNHLWGNQAPMLQTTHAQEILFSNEVGIPLDVELHVRRGEAGGTVTHKFRVEPNVSYVFDSHVLGYSLDDFFDYWYQYKSASADNLVKNGSSDDPLPLSVGESSLRNDGHRTIVERLDMGSSSYAHQNPRAMSVQRGRMQVWFGGADAEQNPQKLYRVQDDALVELFEPFNGPVEDIEDLFNDKRVYKCFGLVDEANSLWRFSDDFSGTVEKKDSQTGVWQVEANIEPYSEQRFARLTKPRPPRIGIKVADTRIERVLPGTPAATAGLQKGDKLLTVNGLQASQANVERAVKDSQDGVVCAPIILEISRSGEHIHVSVTPSCIY